MAVVAVFARTRARHTCAALAAEQLGHHVSALEVNGSGETVVGNMLFFTVEEAAASLNGDALRIEFEQPAR